MKLKLLVTALAVMCLCCVSKKNNSVAPYEQYGHIADSIFKNNKDQDSFIFSKHFENKEDEQSYVAVMTGHLFDKKRQHALLLYSINDSVFRIRLLEKKQSEWKPLVEKSLTHQYIFSAVDELVDFYDVDGDGRKELLLMNEYNDFHVAEFYRGFVLNENTLTEIKGLEEYPNPEFDGDGKIICYRSAGCADMAMYFEEARIDRFKVTRLKEVLCDCCMDSITGDSCEIHIDNQKPFRVKSSEAANFVPKSYYESVKEKVEME